MMNLIEGIDHIGVVVRDLDGASDFFRRAFGLKETQLVDLPEMGMRAMFLACGNSEIELIEVRDPTMRDARLGHGNDARIEHIGFRVPRLGPAVDELKQAGVSMSGQPGGIAVDTPEPLRAAGRASLWTVPSTTAGVMFQFAERESQ